MSCLRFDHKLEVAVRSLGVCDYQVSNRMGIKRKCYTGNRILAKKTLQWHLSWNFKGAHFIIKTINGIRNPVIKIRRSLDCLIYNGKPNTSKMTSLHCNSPQIAMKSWKLSFSWCCIWVELQPCFAGKCSCFYFYFFWQWLWNYSRDA